MCDSIIYIEHHIAKSSSYICPSIYFLGDVQRNKK